MIIINKIERHPMYIGYTVSFTNKGLFESNEMEFFIGTEKAITDKEIIDFTNTAYNEYLEGV
jgi:hypothetical protein